MCTNKPQYWRTAKYLLMHNVRVHTGADDGAYTCMGWGPDKKGVNGVYLRKDVPLQAAKALEACLRTIAPKILTWHQYAEAAYNLFEKTVLGRPVPEYVPDFTECVDHFALHAGKTSGRGLGGVPSNCQLFHLGTPQALGTAAAGSAFLCHHACSARGDMRFHHHTGVLLQHAALAHSLTSITAAVFILSLLHPLP